ncbi:MAG: S41 family peptidase [Flavobacteriales bacterium]|nr:S41 family peptidase [Flavobacteriales bacterium]
MKKKKLALLSLVGGVLTLVSFTVSENYFEISKNLDIFANLYKQLNIYYVDDTNPGELMKTGIDAMLKSLDPYTVYYPESEIEDYRFLTTGEYGGVGSLIRKIGDNVVVAEPYEGFPAHKAGLMAGDVILKIGDQNVAGKNTNDISKLLKGQAKTNVELVIQRGDEKLQKSLVRETIKIEDVPYFGMVSEGIGYIKLTGFTETASKELKDALRDLTKDKKLKGLILDLRGNGGGLLNESVNIVNMFVDQGQEVVHTKGKLKEWDRSHRALSQPIERDLPLAILIDEGSASASEIVSGAIQDLDRGVLIGERTFGKGLVQQTKPLSYNSQLKVTVAKYYIPSGRCIQELDYAHKENGRAQETPDSLLKTFYTKGGRPVKDGRGISPDLKVELPDGAEITGALIVKNHIFNYATEYRRAHDSLGVAKAADFKLSDEDYNDFVGYLKGKDYDYTTQSEKLLEDFKKVSMEEKYFENVKDQYTELKEKISHNKASDLMTNKEEIKEILENEIVSRYYFQTGRIENSLSKDPRVKKAIEVLSDRNQYDKILAKKETNAKK